MLGVLTQLAHMSAYDVCLNIRGMDGVIAIAKVELEKFLCLSFLPSVYLSISNQTSSRHFIIYTIISMFVIR